MASQLPCDFCTEETAVLMMNNLADGSVVTVGAACLPVFFGGAHLGAIGSAGHAGAPTKCQACRRVHEQMTAAATPIAEAPPEDDSAPEVPDHVERSVTG